MNFKKFTLTEARRQFCQIVTEQETPGVFRYVEVTHRGKPGVTSTPSSTEPLG